MDGLIFGFGNVYFSWFIDIEAVSCFIRKCITVLTCTFLLTIYEKKIDSVICELFLIKQRTFNQWSLCTRSSYQGHFHYLSYQQPIKISSLSYVWNRVGTTTIYIFTNLPCHFSDSLYHMYGSNYGAIREIQLLLFDEN